MWTLIVWVMLCTAADDEANDDCPTGDYTVISRTITAEILCESAGQYWRSPAPKTNRHACIWYATEEDSTL